MKRKSFFAVLVFAVLFLLASAGVSAQGKEGTMNITVTIGGAALTPEQQEVYAAYEEICRALIAKDRATLERYYDKDLIFTHINGKRQTRSEYLDEVMDSTLNYYKSTPKDYTIRVNGDTAYMSVTHTLDAKVYGMTGSWTLRGNGTYKKRGGIWVSVPGSGSKN